MQVPADFTQLLTKWRSGHPQALEQLTPLVYDELRRLARSYMRAERGSHTLQATAVVHEAFLRLIQTNVALQDRSHPRCSNVPGSGQLQRNCLHGFKLIDEDADQMCLNPRPFA